MTGEQINEDILAVAIDALEQPQVVSEPPSEPSSEPSSEPPSELPSELPSEPSSEPPSVVFLIPYRDRAQQRAFFQRHMVGTVLADLPPNSWSIWFIHQCDKRRFNRGAMKNLGVRIAQDVYPDHWRDITFVFNDVDTLPFTAGFFDYSTRRGVAKHFFGFTFALGGIASVTGHDFDRSGGFPNLWAWG